MTEHQITARLLRVLRETLTGYVIIKHADSYNFGLPDVSATGDKMTSWWEIKHANPIFKSRGVQWRTCCRLAEAGICYYIIFSEEPQRTTIISPPLLTSWRTHSIYKSGFDYQWVAAFIRATNQQR